MGLVILAHERFPDRAKTAVGLLRYTDHEVVVVLDRGSAGRRVRELLPDVQDAPIVESMDAIEPGTVDALVIGIAPIGGGFDESWRPDVRQALEGGCAVISGLHYFLSEDEEFAALADEHDGTIWDVRRPPEDLTVADGVADTVDATVVLTVGTDCSVGKLTTTMELARAARGAGVDAAVVPTGQTGIVIEGWGTPVDRVVSDFAAGAVEELVFEAGADHDLLFVEGQGSIVHPAYSGVTTALVHGAMPDQLILCHTAGREAIHGYESVSLPSIPAFVDLYESLTAPVSEATVVGGALNTSTLDSEQAARAAIKEYATALDAPATDPVRFGTEPLIEALLA